MKLLLLDVGNTRLKWSLAYERRLARAGIVERAPARRFEPQLRALLRRAAGADRILVCSVAGRAFDRRLATLARAAGAAVPEFVRSRRRAGGVVNGYLEPWRLGVDRWVALIGARHLYPRRALCVVGAGTALTVDLLDERGRHLGGVIVPGPELMVHALLAGTAGIGRRARGGARAPAAAGGLLARHTRAAIEGGALNACAGVIERVRAAGRRRLGRAPLLLLSGGAAPRLRPLLGATTRARADLVMQGLLALAAPGVSSGR